MASTVQGDRPASSGALRAQMWYRPGQAPKSVELDQIPHILATRQGLLWTALLDPEPVLLQQVAQNFGLPATAIEEMLQPHRRPKLIEYSGVLLLVAITVSLREKRPVFGETQILIGQHFLLTIRRSSPQSYSSVRERLEHAPELLTRGSDYVASELMDLQVDHYLQVLDVLEKSVESIEQRFLLHGFQEVDVRRIYRLRRDLLRIHTVITPLAEICRRLARVEHGVIDREARLYFSEVGDRAARTSEFIYALREGLAFAFEGGMMMEQMKQTDTARKLAAWAAILAVPTALAGIYGMNFKFMPELDWTFGYPLTLAVMGTVCGTLFWKFKHMKWL